MYARVVIDVRLEFLGHCFWGNRASFLRGGPDNLKLRTACGKG